MTTDAQKEVRRIYGRGYAAGVAAANATRNEDMTNAARLAEAENTLNAAGKKVLECVPISEPWNITQICAEMARLGRSVDRAHIDGCLASMRKVGLIREPEPGRWIRVVAKPKLVAAPVNPSIMAQADAAEKSAMDPLDRLAGIAQSLRDLSKIATNLANDIEAAALDVESRIEQAGEDGKKLRQLQALLKGLE